MTNATQEEDPKFAWLVDHLAQQVQKRAPNYSIVEDSAGRWQSVEEFLRWRSTYVAKNQLKAYNTRGGGTALPSAEILPEKEKIQQVVEFLKSRESKAATNSEIKLGLKISDEDWDTLKETMKQRRILASFRTRGGGVRLITQDTSKTIQSTVEKLRNIADEKEFCGYVERDWAKEAMNFDYVFNLFGELHGSGKWDNPDIFAIKLRLTEYLRTRPCIIYGIETKLEFNRQAILQTYSYLRFCHYAYLVLPLFEDEVLNKEDGLLAEYATNLGIGVVGLAERVEETASPFVEVIQPRAHIPILVEVDRFLKNHEDRFKQSKLYLDERYFGASLA